MRVKRDAPRPVFFVRMFPKTGRLCYNETNHSGGEAGMCLRSYMGRIGKL